MRFLNDKCDYKNLSPLALAFVGDGFFDLLVRERLAALANRPAGDLHTLAVERVNAVAQAQGFKKIEPLLSEQELAVYKRGRNAHTARVPKNASHAQYHSATGIEALFGYLYMSGETTRAVELFEKIYE